MTAAPSEEARPARSPLGCVGLIAAGAGMAGSTSLWFLCAPALWIAAAFHGEGARSGGDLLDMAFGMASMAFILGEPIVLLLGTCALAMAVAMWVLRVPRSWVPTAAALVLFTVPALNAAVVAGLIALL